LGGQIEKKSFRGAKIRKNNKYFLGSTLGLGGPLSILDNVERYREEEQYFSSVNG
jgi:hypothetical protein